MSGYTNNSIFWVETEKIQPNPFQPRREFEPNALADLADSIRQYGVLQPLVVTRKEEYRNDGGMEVSYELIAGERRLRASKLAGLQQVPVIIRQETDEKVKLELAIIENLQREDLNPIDRALAFEQLYKEFNLTHAEIGKKMGKSRVYVSNTLRLLALPDDIKKALTDGKITEGHTRPLLMLIDRPEEQATLYREIVVKNMSVRDAEKIARKVAQDKVRKKEFEVDPKIRVYEKKMSENLGTRVQIEPKENGGKIVIDYFTLKDLDTILDLINKSGSKDAERMMNQFVQQKEEAEAFAAENKQQESDLSHSTAVSFDDTPEEYEPVTDQEGSQIEDEPERESEPHVSDFLTGNPYKKEAPSTPQPSLQEEVAAQINPITEKSETPNTEQFTNDYGHTVTQEKVASAPEEPVAPVPPVEQTLEPIPQNLSSTTTQEAPTDTEEEYSGDYEYIDASQEPELTPVSDLHETSGIPTPEVVKSQEEKSQDMTQQMPKAQEVEHLPTETYPQGDPYLEAPTVATPKDEISNYGQVHREAPQQQPSQSYDQYQPPANAGNQYSRTQSSQYGNVSYQQQPQKKSFLKKIFG